MHKHDAYEFIGKWDRVSCEDKLARNGNQAEGRSGIGLQTRLRGNGRAACRAGKDGCQLNLAQGYLPNCASSATASNNGGQKRVGIENSDDSASSQSRSK